MKKILICFALLIFGVRCQAGVQTQFAIQPTPEIGFTVPVLPAQDSEDDNSQIAIPALTSSPLELEFLIEKAKEDLAQRLSISITQIDLVEATEMVWPDTSLGCPLPGMVYEQVQTAGYIIQLEANREKYGYHTDIDNTVFLCEPASIESGSQKETDKNVEDGWPNQTKDNDVIIITPTPRK